MDTPKVLYALEDRVCFLRLEGKVRYPQTKGLGAFAERLFEAGPVDEVVIDLRELKYVDSTNLGELMHVAYLLRKNSGCKPVVISPQPTVSETLGDMGMDKLFRIVREPDDTAPPMEAMPDMDQSCREQTQAVLEAHRRLMSLNERNREVFRDVVEGLERELDRPSDATGDDSR